MMSVATKERVGYQIHQYILIYINVGIELDGITRAKSGYSIFFTSDWPAPGFF